MYMDDRSSNRGALESKIKHRFGSIYSELFVLSNGHDRVSDFSEDSVQRFHWGIYDGYDSDEYFSSLDTLKYRLREGYRNGEFNAVQAEIDEYTRNLREAASAFAALFNPSQRPDDIEMVLKRLFALGRVANVLPVLMAAQMEYGDDMPHEMTEIVRACETLVFRVYATDGRRSDTGRGRLVRLAHSIHSDDSYLFEDVLDRLDSITRSYTDDGRFERNLRDPDFYESMSSRDTRYLLHQYGERLGNDVHEDAQPDLERILSTDFEVEHILARGLDEEYIPEDLVKDFEDTVHRMGNLTIASSYWNKSLSDLPFAKKKNAEGRRQKEYKSSILRVQQQLATYERFGKKEIEEREQDIIDFALDEWATVSVPQSSAGSSAEEGTDTLEYDSLPDSFFRRLTKRQEVFIRILLESGDWMRSKGIRQRMADEYDLSSGGSRAVTGIISGWTRKYSSDFTWNLIHHRSADNRSEYRLNPDSDYIEELRERLTRSVEES